MKNFNSFVDASDKVDFPSLLVYVATEIGRPYIEYHTNGDRRCFIKLENGVIFRAEYTNENLKVVFTSNKTLSSMVFTSMTEFCAFIKDSCDPNEKYFTYLDKLKESGITNMYGAAPYIQTKFPEVSHTEAVNILAKWMKTFSERQGK